MELNPRGGYVLCNDLFLSEEFTPLFNSARFAGVFDGNHHTIHHLMLHRTGDSGAAMFMSTDRVAEIRDLTLENVAVEADLIASPLVLVNAGTISNVHVTSGSIESARGWAGAVAGMSSTLPINCTNAAAITGSTTNGGLVGLLTH